ncbi:MAG: calcium/sodium antiporter [Halobacteriota archaeon]|nr:calcium/sodium antiporter [Halobacteriota archaeon]
MLQLLLFIIALLAGFAIMIKSADVVTDHASSISKKRGISEMTIGMILVALATSLPELGVSTTSAFFGKTDIALGNVLGSNVANIALVLGICALIRPIEIDRRAVEFDGFWMLISTAVVAFLMYIGDFGRIDGGISLLVFFVFIYFLRRNEKSGSVTEKSDESILIDIVASLVAGILVWIGSWLVMYGIEGFAEAFGVNPIYLALTVVALGTSLPELVVSVSALRKGMRSISVGNLIGSNMFNLLIVLGLSSIIRPIPISPSIQTFYVPMVILTSVLGVIFMRTGWEAKRWEGTVLLGLYVLFIFLIFQGY